MKRLIAIILVLMLTVSLCPALAEYTDSDTILAVQQALADFLSAGIYVSKFTSPFPSGSSTQYSESS